MKTTEENLLATKEEERVNLIHSQSLTTSAVAEIQSSIIIAKKFPRNEDKSYEKLMKACKRTSFAKIASYSFPRGGSTVSGPSINLAREAARVWENIEYGIIVIRDDEDERQIRAFAWDKETNSKVFAEDSFKKLVYRKAGGGQWVKPDERDLRELTNRRGAILVRNCILSLLPSDIVEDAINSCKTTLKDKAQKDPDGERKAIIISFSKLHITPEMLSQKLGHPIAESSSEEIAELREIYFSIKDGNSKWHEYLDINNEDNGKNGNKTKNGHLDMSKLKPKKQAGEPPAAKNEPTPKDMLQSFLAETFNGECDEIEKWLEEKTKGKAKVIESLTEEEALSLMEEYNK